MAKGAVEDIFNSENKPERVTITSIGKKIGYLSLLEKQLDKMPLTKAYIESIVESTDDFRIRRVRWATEQLHAKGEEILEWKILKKAGLKPNLPDRVIDVVKEIVDKK